MPFILIFANSTEPLSFLSIREGFRELLGIDCALQQEGEEVKVEKLDYDNDGGLSVEVWVDLPELDPAEGHPIVHLDSHPRLDREEAVQSIVEEILDQDETLAEIIEKNGRDFMLTFETTPAGLEAARALAYVLSSETQSGVLVSESAEEETWWFDNAEEFGDAVFGEPDDGEE